jgi:hypothetical protein
MPFNIGGNILTNTQVNVYNGSRIVRNGLLMYLDAGVANSYPGSGTTWTDLSLNGYNGTLINGPTYSTTSGGVLVFDGSNDYAEINVNSWIRSTSSAYTFSSFFYLTTSDGGAPYSLMTSPNAGDTNDGFWQHLNLGNWLWRTEDNVSGEFGGNVESPSPFSSGNWYHIATVIKTNSLIFYRNGLPVATISTTFNWANLRNDHTAYLYLATGYSPEIGYHLNGRIANFSFYNRELSAAEILQNFNADRRRFGI